MIKINPDPTFDCDVEITVPGQEEPGTVPITYKYRGRDEYLEWIKSLGEVDGEDIAEKSTADAFPEFVDSWGLSEDFTQENISIFLNNYPAAYIEIFKKYSEMLMVSRIKN